LSERQLLFLPIGFGFWPRKFPFAISLVAGVCLVWSFLFFSAPQGIALVSQPHAGWKELLRATFTHSGYVHLCANLFLLFIFGVWVEQREGGLFAAGIFVCGSVVGLIGQMLIDPDQAVLGVSAGSSALMGAFFIFFRRADFTFVFTLPPFYSRRLSVPLLWLFPVMFLASDLAELGARHSAIAHWAHVFGTILGMAVAYGYDRLQPLPNGMLFPQELSLLIGIRSAKDSTQLWLAFKELEKWNIQNQKGIELFLGRANQLNISYGNKENNKVFERAIEFSIRRTLKQGSVKDVIRLLYMVPEQYPVEPILMKAPLAQLLQIADKTAMDGNFRVALPLYRSAFAIAGDSTQKSAIEHAIKAIESNSIARGA
jgi:membrane associated rhomboid family serine protease